MTISSTARKAGPFSGTGAQTAYPFNFKVFAPSDVLVVQTDAAGAEHPLTLGSSYSVALNSDQDGNPGGTVILISALPLGQLLTLTSSIPLTQGASIPNMGGFYPKVIEQALDKLTIAAQQAADIAGRGLRFPLSDASPQGGLPTATARAGKFLAFDASGNPTPAGGTGADAALRSDLAAGLSGSAIVAFIHSGLGAIVRTVLDKLRESVSVKDYGAVCDGATDDSAAVAQAQTAAGKRSLLFPGVTHIGTALTITATIADTGEQIFSATSQVKIANGRKVRAAWFGAKTDNATESSAPIMRALAAAGSTAVTLDAGSYRTNSTIVVKGNAVDGYQKLRGAGWRSTILNCYGAGPGLQSDQGLADYCELSGFSVVNVGAPATLTGLDIGTSRNGKFSHIISKDFLVGVALSKSVDAVGDYYNSLKSVVADCGAAPAGSIGFQFGNNLPGHSNPTSNANDMTACRSYGCETGIWINGTGNTIKGQKLVSCKKQVVIAGGFDNDIEAYCESQIPTDSMGSADASSVGNRLRLFNDALDLQPFVDNGWNNITGNIQAGGVGYPAPFRIIDCKIVDHINVQGKTGAAIPVFSITLPERDGSIKVNVVLAGYTFTIGTWSGDQQWSAYRKASGVPVCNLNQTFGDNRFTVTAAADGTLTWSITGNADPALFTSLQISLDVLGICADTSGLGAKISYRRLV